MKVIKVTNEQFRYLMCESEYNFHVTRYGEHDKQPYKSENRFMCYHDTGQFGSGTYFSTYTGPYNHSNDYMRNYGESHPNQDPEFIKIGDGLYRVDFDLYNNLYRVTSERQGDVLHTTLSYLNGMFHNVSGQDLGRYNPKNARYDNARAYQIIQRNCEALGLKCPSYMELTRMAQGHAQSDNTQSFSTWFMEYNGYNGVNVSGVAKFDNSRHGSVIYDLSKTGGELVQCQVPQNNVRSTVGMGHNNSVASTSLFPEYGERSMLNSLVGKFEWYGFREMSEQEKMRAVKNIISYGRGFEGHDLEKYFGDSPRIVNYIMKKMLDRTIPEEYTLEYSMVDYIVEHKYYDFINFVPQTYGNDTSFLIRFLCDFNYELWMDDDEDDEVKQAKLKQYLNWITSKLKRDLTAKEKKYIENDYFDVD